MNSHEEIRSHLAAYSCGELTADTEQRVRDHLAACPECRAELADLESVLRLLRTTPAVEPPPWLTTRIMARLSEQQSHQQGWLRRLFLPLHIKLPLEAAALLVVCLTGWYLTRTVETELKQGSLRTEVIEQAAPPTKSEIMKPAAEQPTAEVRKAAPAPAAPQQGAPIQPEPLSQPAAPETPPLPTVSPVQPPPAAPAAVPRLRQEEKALPAAGSAPTPLQSAPKAETADRLRDATSEGAHKALKGVQRNAVESYAPAPAGRAAGKPTLPSPPVLSIHLETTNPAAAPAAIREAAERSGGYVTDGRALTDHRITVTVPTRRLIEFHLRLSRIGRVPPAPPVDPELSTVTVTVSW
jgi:hypothetical protein